MPLLMPFTRWLIHQESHYVCSSSIYKIGPIRELFGSVLCISIFFARRWRKIRNLTRHKRGLNILSKSRIACVNKIHGQCKENINLRSIQVTVVRTFLVVSWRYEFIRSIEVGFFKYSKVCHTVFIHDERKRKKIVGTIGNFSLKQCCYKWRWHNIFLCYNCSKKACHMNTRR